MSPFLSMTRATGARVAVLHDAVVAIVEVETPHLPGGPRSSVLLCSGVEILVVDDFDRLHDALTAAYEESGLPALH